MKKYLLLSLSLLWVLSASALAAAVDGGPAQYDILDLEPPALSSSAPDASVEPAANEPAEPIDGSGDVPVDESACREETPGGSLPAQRQPGRGTIGDLYAYWEENGYPDDVSYAYLAGGEVVDGEVLDWWEIGLVGNDPARRQEILALAAPSCLVEFKNALFSHAEKVTAYDRLTELAVTDPNILSVIFVRNDDTVWVAVPEALAKDYAQYLIRDLGLGAVVSVTDEGSLAVTDLETGVLTGTVPGGGLDGAMSMGASEGGAEKGGIPVLWVCLAVAVLAAALTAGAVRQRLVPAAAAADGSVRERSTLSRRETEELVKNRAETPDPALYQAILQKLSAEQKSTVKADE